MSTPAVAGRPAPHGGLVAGIAYASFALIGWSTLLIPALIRSLEADFGQTDGGIGLFYLVNASSFALGSLGGGFATERFGRRFILTAGAVLLGLGLGVEGSTGTWILFVAAGVPSGLGAGAVDGGMNALILDLAARRPSGALNLLHLFFSIGAAGSPLVVGQLVAAGVDWRTILVATAAVALAVGGMLAARPMPSGRHRRVPRDAGDPLLGPWLRRRPSVLPIVLLGMAMVFYVSAELGASSWVVRFLAAATDGAATAALAGFWAGESVSRLAASRFADRFPPFAFATTCTLAAAAALGGAIVVPWLPVSAALFAVCGLAFGPVYPMIMSIAGSLYPGRLAAVTGSLAAFAVIGSIVYPPVMGFISEAASVGLAMTGAGLLAVACALTLVAAGVATRRRPTG